MCFLDENQDTVKIEMNPDEFIDYKWLTVEDALHEYSKEKLSLFVPQVHILS